MGSLLVLAILSLSGNSFVVLGTALGLGCGEDPSCFNMPSSWFIGFLLFGFLQIWFSKIHFFFSSHFIFFGFGGLPGSHVGSCIGGGGGGLIGCGGLVGHSQTIGVC